MLCKVCPYQIVLSILLIFPLKRLRNHARFDPIHIDAESLQHDLPRRRARDDACFKGIFSVNFPPAFFVSLCQHFGVASAPWSPLARGLLARPARAERTTRGSFDQYV